MAKLVRVTAIFLAGGVAGFAIWRAFANPAKPTAILRVVDAAGRPVPGATIKREGMRTKAGAYSGGWYGWAPERNGVPNPPVVTDANGEARIEYPKYVFEKVETGVVCLAVDHPDFVSQRPERTVDTSLPANAKMRDHLSELAGRFWKNQALTARPDPIVLKKGGILKITVPPESRVAPDAPLWGQVSKSSSDTSFWIHPGPGMIATRRLAEGTQAVRVVQFDPHGAIWFSEVTNVFAKTGEEVERTLRLERGAAVRGKLDSSVPRPVTDGRVIVEVRPPGFPAENYPPDWHSWTAIRPDGSFEFASLPPGNLEIAAICQGFISTNGSGKFHFHYPQQHTLGADDLEIVIGMQPTARLEVTVVDQNDRPVPNANVGAWPNLRWAEWGAVIFGKDLYDTGDWVRGVAQPRMIGEKPDAKTPEFHDFDGTTDARGFTVIPNLPLDVDRLAVNHEKYQIPAVNTGTRDERHATVTLHVGVTNYLKIVVEPISGANQVKHR